MLKINTKLLMLCFFTVAQAVGNDADAAYDRTTRGTDYRLPFDIPENAFPNFDVGENGASLSDIINRRRQMNTLAATAGAPPPDREPFSRGNPPVSINASTLTQGTLRDFIEFYFRQDRQEWLDRINFIIPNNYLGSTLRQASRVFDRDNSAQENNVDHQEALTQQRENIRNAYAAMATSAHSGSVIAQLLPEPNAESLDVAFKESASNLNVFLEAFLRIKDLSTHIKFRLKNANRALALLGGDESIEHHTISPTQQYQTYSHEGLPHIKQLFVLAQRLSEVDASSFVESILAELCNTKKKWRNWAKPFEGSRFERIINQENVGLALSFDRSEGSPLVKSIAAVLKGGDVLPVPLCVKQIVAIQRAFMKKQFEEAMPLIEALFMVMRGHNVGLLDENEANMPACAEGAYLGLLKAISEKTKDDGFLSLGVEVVDCAVNQQPTISITPFDFQESMRSRIQNLRSIIQELNQRE